MQGGNGGAANGGNGGLSASVSLNNAVSGSTTGSLNLYQNAYGGNGGSTVIGGSGQPGASASSTLTVNDLMASFLRLHSQTVATQPTTPQVIAARGSAVTVVAGIGSVQGQSSASGGNGTSAPVFANGGNGGSATASTSATGAGGYANAVSTAYGGAGGAAGIVAPNFATWR